MDKEENSMQVPEAEIRSFFFDRFQTQKNEARTEREATIQRVRQQVKGKEIIFENRCINR